jgi:hypothetical protein
MFKKAKILINLNSEASKFSKLQIEEIIRKQSNIPLCEKIDKISIEDTDISFMNLKNKGISHNVAKNIMNLYTQ